MKMSIKMRLIIALGGFSLATAVVISLVFTLFMENLMVEAEDQQLENLFGNLKTEIASEGTRALSLAALVAKTPDAQAAMEAEDRDALLAMYRPAFEEMQDRFGVSQFQFHRPPATSLVRIHKPEKFGDDLSGFRKTVVNANLQRRSVQGLERGVAGLGMRGVMPVDHNGKHVGTVEIGLSFGPAFFETFAQTYGADVALYLRDDGGAWQTFAATRDLGDHTEQLDAALAGQVESFEITDSEQNLSVMVQPIQDYQGDTIAVAMIAHDSSLLHSHISDARQLAILATIITLAVATLAGYLIAHRIGGSMRLVSESLTRMSTKDFSIDLPDVRGKGEVPDMLRALGTFRTKSIELDGIEREHDTYLKRVEQRRRELETQSREVLRGVVSATVQANEAIVALTHMTRDVEAASSQSQAMASAVEEMVASTQEISASSSSAANEAEEARNAAGAGVSGSGRAVETMEGIHSAVSAAGDRVDTLAEASTQIGEIVQQIEDIADQTNLLALNATIEAARAGEAGKGFAVVANQVKSLANQTARATVDIRGRIDTLREEMTTIIQAMEKGAGAVEDGRGVVTGLGDQLETIAGSINTVTDKMHDISSILAQQTQATNEISRGTSSIAMLSQRNSEEVKQALTAMETAAASLNAHVTAFSRLGGPVVLVEVAKNDHIVFKKKIVDAVIGRSAWAERDIPDHKTCRLGKWYTGVIDPDLRNHDAFRSLDGPHADVHRFGREAARKAAAGDMDGAMAAVDALNDSSHRVLERLDTLSAVVEEMTQDSDTSETTV